MTKEEILAMVPDAKLDEIVGTHVTMVRPRINHSIMDRDEKGVFITFSSKEAADDHLKENLEEYPSGLLAKEGAHVVKWHFYPRYSQEITAAWEIFDKFDDILVRKFSTISGEFRYRCSIVNDKVNTIVDGDTVPHALCLAALVSVLRLEATP